MALKTLDFDYTADCVAEAESKLEAIRKALHSHNIKNNFSPTLSTKISEIAEIEGILLFVKGQFKFYLDSVKEKA